MFTLLKVVQLYLKVVQRRIKGHWKVMQRTKNRIHESVTSLEQLSIIYLDIMLEKMNIPITETLTDPFNYYVMRNTLKIN